MKFKISDNGIPGLKVYGYASQEIFKHTIQPFLAIYPDGSIMGANDAFFKLTGYNREEIGSMEDDPLGFYRRVRWAMEKTDVKGGFYRFEEKIVNKNGSLVSLDITIYTSYDRENNKEYYCAFIEDISIRKQAEYELTESEKKYRLIADNSSDMIFIIDPCFLNFMYVSPSTTRVLGYSEEELIGQNCFNIIHSEDKDNALTAFMEGMRKGEGSGQYREIKKDGSYMWVEAKGRVITDDAKTRILILVRDINDRKAAEHALKENELLLRQITDNMLDVICLLDADLVYKYISPSMTNVTGLKTDELIGRKVNLKRLHPEDRTRVAKSLEKLQNNLLPVRTEYRLWQQNEKHIRLETVGKTIVDNAGNISGIVFVTRNIQERRLAEEQIYKHKQKLQNQLNYFNTLIDNMNEFCYTYDRNYRLIFANKRIIEKSGYQLEEAIGRHICDFTHPEDRELVMLQAENRIQKGVVGNYEHRFICKDGSELLLRLKTSPIIENGKVTGGLVLAEDITGQRRIEKEMARLAQLHMVGEMAAGMGHEIRNPMTTVKGFLQILSQDEGMRQHRQNIDIMLEELERANEIITEFLSLAKNKMVDLKLNNINTIIKAIFPLLQADALSADKYINLELAEVADLMLDEKEIRQLIINLVRNGLEATQPQYEVFIRTYCQRDQVILAIEDSGSGIAPEILDKLGTPFVTTKAEGTGLGLAICFSIIQRHNATLDIKSNSKGTTFLVKFTIPGTISDAD